MGNVSNKGKIWKVLLPGIFYSWFVLTELCLYMLCNLVSILTFCLSYKSEYPFRKIVKLSFIFFKFSVKDPSVKMVSVRSTEFMPISLTSIFAKIGYHLHFSCG